MKISVSLPEEDVRFLDEYLHESDASSRSAAVHDAIGLLRTANLQSAYAAAWDEWGTDEDSEMWERTVADGISDAAR